MPTNTPVSRQRLADVVEEIRELERSIDATRTHGILYYSLLVVIIFVGFGILFTWSWQLALIFLISSLPMWIVGFRFEHRYSVVSRRAQDQQGDLATTVEESVHGIRVLKAFGRGKHSLEQFLKQAEELRGTELEKARSIAGPTLRDVYSKVGIS